MQVAFHSFVFVLTMRPATITADIVTLCVVSCFFSIPKRSALFLRHIYPNAVIFVFGFSFLFVPPSAFGVCICNTVDLHEKIYSLSWLCDFPRLPSHLIQSS
jgi:hypothetical protein